MGSRLAGAASVIVPILTMMAQARACVVRLPEGGGIGHQDPQKDRAKDLVELRDIGSSLQFVGKPVLAVSPDSRKIAFQLRQADPRENSYCFAMVVIATSGSPVPRIIDTGGELIRFVFPELVGKANVPSGFPIVVSPQWFPDGQSVAYLKRVNGVTQLWRAFIDGRRSLSLFRGADDLLDFKLLADGDTIIASTRPSLRLALAQIEAEGQRGYIFDDRYFPIASNAPFPRPPLALSYISVNLRTGQVRPATTDEIAFLEKRTQAQGRRHPSHSRHRPYAGPGFRMSRGLDFRLRGVLSLNLAMARSRGVTRLPAMKLSARPGGLTAGCFAICVARAGPGA